MAERKLPCCCRSSVSQRRSTMGPNLLHPWALIWLLSLPGSLIHSRSPDEWRPTMRHSSTMVLITCQCPHFSCQTVVVSCPWQNGGWLKGFWGEAAVWMKGLCTDLIKTQCSNYCSECDKWPGLDTAGRNTHTHTSTYTHRYTPIQTPNNPNKSWSCGVFFESKGKIHTSVKLLLNWDSQVSAQMFSNWGLRNMQGSELSWVIFYLSIFR